MHCCLCLSPSLYYSSSTLRQETLIALEIFPQLHLVWRLVLDPRIANWQPRLPAKTCLTLEVMSSGQVRACSDRQAYPSYNSITKSTTVILIVLVAVYQLVFSAGAIKYLLFHVQQFL